MPDIIPRFDSQYIAVAITDGMPTFVVGLVMALTAIAAIATTLGVVFAIYSGIGKKRRERLNEAHEALTGIMAFMDGMSNRAVTDADLTELGRGKGRFERLAARHSKMLGELQKVVDSINAVASIAKPVDPRDEARYQQGLGEAVGTLRAACTAALAAVHRLRDR
ncbi:MULTISPECIES: hypothetical protein [Streptomyces]|uniref:hypothetical protein n=1 Tax=Streptomyces TaxID=1883 RepID=UPI00369730AA